MMIVELNVCLNEVILCVKSERMTQQEAQSESKLLKLCMYVGMLKYNDDQTP